MPTVLNRPKMKNVEIRLSAGLWIVKERDSGLIYLTTNQKDSAVRFGRSLNTVFGVGFTVYHENGETESEAYLPKQEVVPGRVLGHF